MSKRSNTLTANLLTSRRAVSLAAAGVSARKPALVLFLRLLWQQAVAARACCQSAIGQYVVSPWSVVDRKGSHANARPDAAPYPRASRSPSREKFLALAQIGQIAATSSADRPAIEARATAPSFSYSVVAYRVRCFPRRVS